MMQITKTWFEDGKMVIETIPAENVYKREWVGLTEEDLEGFTASHRVVAKLVEQTLKEKNHEQVK